MKSAVKKAVLSTALSVALAVSVCGGTYRQSDVVVKDSGLEVSSRNSSLTLKTNGEYRSQSIETFINDALGDDIDNIDFVYNELYSEYGVEYGYVLDFSYAYGNGHAIISTVDGSENIAEMDLENSSPYLGKDGKYIYASFDNYFVAQSDGDIVKLESNDSASGISAPMKSKDKERVPVSVDYNYSYGNIEKYEISNFYCAYSTDFSDKKNNCANAAGVIALNYWNANIAKNFLELTYEETLKDGTLNMNEATATKFMNIFYDYMNTNWIFGTGGTLPNNVYGGFKKLLKQYDRETTHYDLHTFEEVKYQVQQGVPVFITSEDYYFTDSTYLPSINSSAGDYSFTINYKRWYGIVNSHTFVGYGYAEYTLYDKDGNESKIELVKIADGWGNARYFNYNISNKMSMAAIKVSRC